MNEINLEQFEMTNESMDKVLGGQQSVATGGLYISEADKWCERDSGTPGPMGTNHIHVYNCHALNDDGSYAD